MQSEDILISILSAELLYSRNEEIVKRPFKAQKRKREEGKSIHQNNNFLKIKTIENKNPQKNKRKCEDENDACTLQKKLKLLIVQNKRKLESGK